MREVQSDPVLGRRDDLPNTVLIDGIKVREGRAGDGAIRVVNPPSTRV